MKRMMKNNFWLFLALTCVLVWCCAVLFILASVLDVQAGNYDPTEEEIAEEASEMYHGRSKWTVISQMSALLI